MSECKYLPTEIMDKIGESFEQAFPNRDTMIIHEIESKFVHTDIGVMMSEDKNDVILYTLGMSAALMQNGRRCELFTKISLDHILIVPECEICGDSRVTPKDCFDEYARDRISTLIMLSKCIDARGEVYKDCDTLFTNEQNTDNGGYYVFRQIFKINCKYRKYPEYKNIDVFYLKPVTEEELYTVAEYKNVSERAYIINELIANE